MDGGFQALVLLVISVVAFGGIIGCSTGSAKNQPSQTPLISVALTQLPPAILPVSTSAQVSATVNNDPADAGVDWVAICGSAGSCGHFTPAHTASGAATTFWAPPAVPAHQTISVTALSTTDHSKASAFSVMLVSTVTSITLTEFPPPTAPAGSSITLSATVAGDPANLGVDWTANCGGINCTPNGFHSSSDGTVNFVIPLPTQSGFLGIVGSTVTITAFATADHSFSAMAPFQVSAPIVVTITQPPPATMLTNATATVVAVVQNDPTNSGVNWNVSCANTPCGTITPLHTASGAPAVFTAPPDVPSTSSPVVTIGAQAAAAPTSSVSNDRAVVTIVLPISIKIIQNVPNSTIVQGHGAQLIATVTNDLINAGVDWSCSPLGSCGTFSPTHTTSGSSTTYTAPPTPSSVTLTATSTADSTKTDTQAVTVIASPPPSGLLSGNFVMLLSSNNSQNGAYILGGVITGQPNGGNDNNGGAIKNANFDLADASGNTGNSVGILSPSTYSIDQNGRGQIQLLISTGALQNGRFGVSGTASACGSAPHCGSLTLSVVFVTPQHAILSESDSFGTASGTLDLQNLQDFSGSISPGVYSLSLSGSEKALPSAGYFMTSAVSIASTTSYSYITDQSDGGLITSVPFTSVSQGFANGGFSGGNLRLQFVNLGLPTQFNLTLWAIDATHFVVTDLLDSLLGTPNVIVSGHFTAQPSAPTISGTYAFTEMGASIAAASPQAAGGVLTCGSTGTLDVVPLNGTVNNTTINNVMCGAVSNGVVTPGAVINGRSQIGLPGVASSIGINQFAAYPTVDQGLYLIELDGGALGSSGAGVAVPQTLSPPIAGTALNGKYASNFNASTTLGSQAFAAQIAADGSSTLTGTGDVNSFDATAATPVATASPDAGFSGTYSSSNNGRFPITLTITPASGQPPPQITNLNLACYLVDANTCMLLGLDATAPGTGMLLLQNTGQ
jgi:hypothetical protein